MSSGVRGDLAAGESAEDGEGALSRLPIGVSSLTR